MNYYRQAPGPVPLDPPPPPPSLFAAGGDLEPRHAQLTDAVRRSIAEIDRLRRENAVLAELLADRRDPLDDLPAWWITFDALWGRAIWSGARPSWSDASCAWIWGGEGGSGMLVSGKGGGKWLLDLIWPRDLHMNPGPDAIRRVAPLQRLQLIDPIAARTSAELDGGGHADV